VLVVERRSQIGGNVQDHVHSSGIRIHTYGPHYFRTSDETIWSFVNRFTAFDRYEAVLKSFVDGAHENWPIAMSYIRRTVGEGWKPEFCGKAADFEQASLSMMPRLIYEKFVKGYSEKQWGVPACSLSSDLAKRFDVRLDDEPRLVRHQYQGIPTDGYSAFMRNMLEGIPVIVNCDYLQNRDDFHFAKNVVFTGPIDEFFHFDLGKLVYRGQDREDEYLADCDWHQPCGQVNNPDPALGSHIRTMEWKHMMPAAFASKIHGTVITRETPVAPQSPDAYEYPFPDEKNRRLYERYRSRANAMENVLVCGRLGEYKYYDMDQAIARAMVLAQNLLDADQPLRYAHAA
jgi:UDP-galactopyranose mutase